MKTILALDLGKFKTVSCLLTVDHASIPVFKTIMTKTWGQSPRFRRNSASPIPSNRDIDEVVFPSNRQMIAERRNLPGESKYPVVSRVFERRTLHLTLHRRACGIFKQKPKRPVVTDDQERLGTIALPWEPI